MTQQILYSTSTGEIIQWQDTAAFNYAPAPSGAATLPVTPAQWAVQTGVYVSGGKIVTGTAPTPAPTLAQAQAAQTATIITAAQAALQAVVAAYPDLEVATWPQQYAEAQAYTASSTAATPMLAAIATAARATVAVMAAGVMAKAAAYQSASGAIIGKRIALTGEIAAATTVAAVQAVTW